MNSFISRNTIRKEDLQNLLPKSLIDILDDQDSSFFSPQNSRIPQDLEEIYENSSPKFTPSPQIPPLESRLHSYLLKNNVKDDIAKPCNLSKFFNDLNMDDEIQNALLSMPQRVKIWDFLEEDGFFERVSESVEDYRKKLKPKLNAQALSFVPDSNKENIIPKKAKNF